MVMLVVCCSEIKDARWRWIEASLVDTGVRFEFVSCIARSAFGRSLQKLINLARVSGSFEAVRMAQRSGARALVAHGPALSAWCALFARLVGLKIPIVAHSFNFTKLPPGIK